MFTSALDIGAIFILVLPGFLAYRAAVERRVDPAPRSTLWQLSEILEYSVYVHLFGLLIVFSIVTFLGLSLNIETHLSELPTKGFGNFLESYYHEGIVLFILYPVYVIFGAIWMGVFNVPNCAVRLIIMVTIWAIRQIARVPCLKWVPVPRYPYPTEPVWYKAFNTDTYGFTVSLPVVMVIMKSGATYYGNLSSYPILPDSQKDKDFIVTNATYSPAESEDIHELADQSGGGSVLLNTANVDSIQIYYESIADDQQNAEDSCEYDSNHFEM